MKLQMKKSDLADRDDIWNAVIQAISEFDLPMENGVKKEAYIVFQYYAELASGGHESLFNWLSDYIKEVGISNFLKELIEVLNKIGAGDYAEIEKAYGEEIWSRLAALENGRISEENFYEVIEKADNAYYQLDNRLDELLAAYFVDIHEELIDVLEDEK